MASCAGRRTSHRPGRVIPVLQAGRQPVSRQHRNRRRNRPDQRQRQRPRSQQRLHRIGVIGGSDGHNLYGDRIQGLTGVYADAHTRPAIFDAIRKRRCYATTGEPIHIDFRVNGHFMGAEIEAASGPVIEARVAAQPI